MSRLLDGPMKPWIGEAAEEVPDLGEPDFTGFERPPGLAHHRLPRTGTRPRPGKSDSGSLVYGYRRLKVLKRPENTGNNVFRMRRARRPVPGRRSGSRPRSCRPRLRMSQLESDVAGEKQCRWQASCDFQSVPAGEYVDLIYEHSPPGNSCDTARAPTSLAVPIQAETAEVTRWFLMPEGKEYRSFRILRYKTGKPETAEAGEGRHRIPGGESIDPRLQVAVGGGRLHLRGHLVLQVGTRVAQPRGR